MGGHTKQSRLGMAAAVAALALVALAAAWERHAAPAADARPVAGGPRLLLPDLIQALPHRVGVSSVAVEGRLRFRLGFGSGVENVGAGPLIVLGRRPDFSRQTMSVSQLIRRGDGSTATRGNAGSMRYVNSATHEHWHLLGVDRYSLRSERGNRIVVSDRKTGFCLGDRYEGDVGPRPRASPGFRGLDCGSEAPRLLSVLAGISIGWGDDYEPFREGQYLDVTNVRAGRYYLVHRANADRRLREIRYGNNASSLLLRLTWPRGPAARPRVKVLRAFEGTRAVPPADTSRPPEVLFLASFRSPLL